MQISDNDTFEATGRTLLYVTLLDAGYSSNDASDIADYSLAHPAKLLEDCKPSIARKWCDETFNRASWGIA